MNNKFMFTIRLPKKAYERIFKGEQTELYKPLNKNWIHKVCHMPIIRSRCNYAKNQCLDCYHSGTDSPVKEQS